jgi:long-chain acyl-CoA synthetase
MGQINNREGAQMKNVPFKSVPDMLRSNAVRFDERLALKYRKLGKFVTLTYGGYYERSLMVARGLAKMQVSRGDRIAILSENRAGWVIADMGILILGAVTVPIYATNTPEQIEYMLNHSGAKIVFVSSRLQYAKLLKVRERIPRVELVVSFERFLGDPLLPVCTFLQLSEIDDPVTPEEKRELEAVIDRTGPDDLLTIIYTSGTTGVPKGVMLSHGNILFDAWYAIRKSEALASGEIFLSFLPMSHIFERTAGYYIAIMNGSLLAFADSIEKVAENMAEIKPTVMVCVPRLFEKIYSRIFENVHKMPLLKRTLFHLALEIGKEYVTAKYITKQVGTLLTLKYRLADHLIFSKLRQKFGGSLKFFCSGGAPLDSTINEFFWVIGIPVLEGYGLTETSPIISLNNHDHVRFGSVGTAIEETEVKTDANGEILVRGPQVMLGYYKDPEGTAAAMQDGWFRTGDIGRIEDNFIYITDRMKEVIITAGGKNIPPQPIENMLKLDKYISSAYVYGDRKPYLTALIVPNLERLLDFARDKRIHYYDIDDLVIHEPVVKLLEQRIAEINKKLAQFESIKKFVLLPRDFSIEGGELTPTLKMRRKIIFEKYRDKIEGMYTEV